MDETSGSAGHQWQNREFSVCLILKIFFPKYPLLAALRHKIKFGRSFS